MEESLFLVFFFFLFHTASRDGKRGREWWFSGGEGSSYDVLTAFLLGGEGGKLFPSPQMSRVIFCFSLYFPLLCIFWGYFFFFFFFHYLNSSLSQLCQMIIKMESKVTTLLFQPFFFYYWIHSSLQVSRIIQNNKKEEKNHSLTTCWHVQPVTGFYCVIFKGHKTKKAPAPLLYNS